MSALALISGPTPEPDRNRAADAIRTPQLYEAIAQRLIGWIDSGQLRPGDRLPSERELAVRLSVSRSSVREAIAALQVEGILQTRPGAGSFVVERQRSAAEVQAAEGRLAIAYASPFAMLQARETLEPGIARAAAERAQPSERAAGLLEQMERSTDARDPAARAAWSDADRLFHREIAAISGNPVLLALADQIAALMDEPLWRRLRDDLISVPGRTVTHLAEHRLIYQSVIEGQPEAAALQALHHVQRVHRLMRD